MKLLSNDTSGDAAISQAVKQAQPKIDSGETTGADAARAKSLDKSVHSKGMTDIMRENMRSARVMQSQAAEQARLAEAVAVNVDACKSTTCLAMVEARSQQDLYAATGGDWPEPHHRRLHFPIPTQIR